MRLRGGGFAVGKGKKNHGGCFTGKRGRKKTTRLPFFLGGAKGWVEISLKICADTSS